MIKRILSAIVLLPAFVWAIFYMPAVYFNYLVLGIGCIAAWEWTRLMGSTVTLDRALSMLFLLAAGYALYHFVPTSRIVQLSSFWWVIAIFCVISFPLCSFLLGNKIFAFVVGGIILTAALLSLGIIRSHSPWQVLFVCGMVWAGDIGAYFAGKSIGRHKLCPKVSPGKTWEGILGGLLLTALFVIAYGYFGPQKINFNLSLLILVVAVYLISVIGDLTISMFKRIHGVKDSGHIIPGHGGVLDRIDSLIAAFPIFCLLYY